MKKTIIIFLLLSVYSLAQENRLIRQNDLTDSLNAIRTLIGTGGIALPDSVLFSSDSTAQRTFSDAKYVDKDSIQTWAETLVSLGVVTVELFGAVGDGVTNDALAFQSAFDYLYSNSGGTILLKPVIYKVGSQLKPYSNITIEGNGATLLRDTLTITGSDTNYAPNTFMIYSADDIDNFNVKDLTVQDYHSENASVYRGFLALYGDVSDCTFDNLTFLDSYSGIYQTNLGSFTNITVKNCKGYGRYKPTGETANNALDGYFMVSLGSAFNRCKIIDNYTNGIGLSYGGGEHTMVKNNIVYNTPNTAIYFYGSYNLIDGNKVYNAGKDGIKINVNIAAPPYGDSHNNTITNNYVKSCGRIEADGGTYYQMSGYNTIFSNNTAELVDSSDYATLGMGAVSIGGDNSILSNNLIYCDIPIDSQFGITTGFFGSFDYGNGYANNVTINNNIIRGVGHAVYVNEACDNWTIINNYINARRGIESPSTVATPRNWVIQGNTLKDTSDYKNIYPLLGLTNMENSLISGNVIFDDDTLYANDNPSVNNINNIIVRDGKYILSDNRQKTTLGQMSNPALTDTMIVGVFDKNTKIDSIWFKTDDSISVQIRYGANGAGQNLIYGNSTPVISGEKALDGGFATEGGIGYWNIYGGITVTGGEAVFDTDSISYVYDNGLAVVVGTRYIVEFTVSDYTSGSVHSQLGQNSGLERTSTGTFIDTLVCTKDWSVNIATNNGFVGSVDSVSIKEISSSQIIAGEEYFSAFDNDEIPAGDEAYLYFTNIGDTTKFLRFKIYWRDNE